MADTANVPTYEKDPDDILDFHWNWRPYLSDGELITASEFLVTAGVTIGPTPPSSTTQDATLWLSGGDIGQVYRCTNRITTNQGRQVDRSINVRVKDL